MFESQKPSIPFTQNILSERCYAYSGFFAFSLIQFPDAPRAIRTQQT